MPAAKDDAAPTTPMDAPTAPDPDAQPAPSDPEIAAEDVPADAVTSDHEDDCDHESWHLVGSVMREGRYVEVTEECNACGKQRTRRLDDADES